MDLKFARSLLNVVVLTAIGAEANPAAAQVTVGLVSNGIRAARPAISQSLDLAAQAFASQVRATKWAARANAAAGQLGGVGAMEEIRYEQYARSMRSEAMSRIIDAVAKLG